MTQRPRTVVADTRASVLLCAAAAALSSIAWRNGSGLGPDSVTYIDAAQNLAAGRGLVHRWAYWDPVYESCELPTSSTLWPPGYAVCIAALASRGVDAEFAARLLSAACFVLLPLPLFGLLRDSLRPVTAAFLTLCGICTLPLVVMSASVATENTFLLASSTAAFASLRALRTTQSRRELLWWIAAGVAAGVSLAFRYVGVATIAAVLLSALHARRDRLIVVLFRAAVPAVLVSAAALLPGWLANRAAGPGWPGSHIFWSTLPTALRGVIGATIGSKELLDAPPWSLLRPAQLVLATVLTLLFVTGIVRRRRTPSARNDGSQNAVPFILALFSTMYVGAVLVGRAAKGMDVEERYLTLIAPWVVTIVGTITMSPPGPALPRLRNSTALITFACLLVCQCAVIARWSSLPAHVGYIDAARRSRAVDWICSHVPPDQTILNTRGADLALWIPNPSLRPPRAPFSRTRTVNWTDVDRIADKAGARFLVHWPGFPERSKYDDEEFRFLRSLDDPAAHSDRSAIALPDCVIYRVGSRRDGNT